MLMDIAGPVLKATCKKLPVEIMIDFEDIEVVANTMWVAWRIISSLVGYSSSSDSVKVLVFMLAIAWASAALPVVDAETSIL